MTNITANAIMNLKEVPQTLHVHGSIITYRIEDKVILTKKEPQGINPSILLLDLNVIEGNGPMKGTPKHFHYELSDEAAKTYSEVTIHHSFDETFTTKIETLG